LIERVKRWLASCGEVCESRVGKLERPSAGRTRNLRVFFLFAFSLSIVLSERAKVNKAQEHRNDADRSRRHSAQNVRTASEKSTKNRSKIDENPCQIDQKLMENRSWAVLGAQSRFGDVSGRARDGLWTAKCCPKADLEAARASRETSKSVPGPPRRRSRTAPEQCPSAFGASSAIERACRGIFHRFCVVARKLRSAFRIGFCSTFSMSQAISTERARAAKKLEISCVSASKIELGSVWASQNRAPAAKFDRQNAKKPHEAQRFFFCGCGRANRSEKVRAVRREKARRPRGARELVRFSR